MIDDDRPPVVMPPVRRDPAISLRDQPDPFGSPPVDEYGRPRPIGRPVTRRHIAAQALMVLALLLMIVIGGAIVIHVIWRAIMYAWNL